MCEQQHEHVGHCEISCPEEIDLAEAAAYVVQTMSQKTKDNLLELLIGQMLGDAGDASTKEQFDAVVAALPAVAFYVPDTAEVRRVVACASALFGMVAGAGNDDAGVIALATATVNKKQWAGRIW